MKQKTEYEKWGMIAAVPGIQMSIDHLQSLLDSLKAATNRAMNGTEPEEEEEEPPKQKKGRPPGKTNKNNGYWESMTPEARSLEMKRRQRVANGVEKSRKDGTVRKIDPATGRNSIAYRKKMAAAQRKMWAMMTPAERQARVDAMRRAGAKRKSAA